MQRSRKMSRSRSRPTSRLVYIPADESYHTASLLPHYTVYMNDEFSRRGSKGAHLPRPVFPEEKASYIY